MAQSFGCWQRKRKQSCHCVRIGVEEEVIDYTTASLKKLTNEQEQLNRAIKTADIEKLMKWKLSYIDGYFHNIQTEKNLNFGKKKEAKVLNCPFSPSMCEHILHVKLQIKKELQERLADQLAIYNATVGLIQQLKYFYMQELEKEKRLKLALYLRVRQIAPYHHIALYFNMDLFMGGRWPLPLGTLYLFSSTEENKYKNVLKFKYAEGVLRIEALRTTHLQSGYESYLLQGLEEMTPYLNDRLKQLKLEPIKRIETELYPCSTVPRESLVKLYQTNGYSSYGKTFNDGTYIPHQAFYKLL